MKKKVLLLIFALFSLTGCVNINKITNDELIEKILTNESYKANTALEGYKIYLPNNMTLLGDVATNNVLYANSDKYYLYVDLVSYYNKVNNDFKINKNNEVVFLKELENNNKKGYVLITKYKDKYFVEVMYNYSKIEVITKQPKVALTNSLIVLNSVTYNDKIIETLVGSNVLDYDEEHFKLIGPNDNTSKFLQYEEDYGTYEDTSGELPDEDKIEIEEIE